MIIDTIARAKKGMYAEPRETVSGRASNNSPVHLPSASANTEKVDLFIENRKKKKH